MHARQRRGSDGHLRRVWPPGMTLTTAGWRARRTAARPATSGTPKPPADRVDPFTRSITSGGRGGVVEGRARCGPRARMPELYGPPSDHADAARARRPAGSRPAAPAPAACSGRPAGRGPGRPARSSQRAGLPFVDARRRWRRRRRRRAVRPAPASRRWSISSRDAGLAGLGEPWLQASMSWTKRMSTRSSPSRARLCLERAHHPVIGVVVDAADRRHARRRCRRPRRPARRAPASGRPWWRAGSRRAACRASARPDRSLRQAVAVERRGVEVAQPGVPGRPDVASASASVSIRSMLPSGAPPKPSAVKVSGPAGPGGQGAGRQAGEHGRLLRRADGGQHRSPAISPDHRENFRALGSHWEETNGDGAMSDVALKTAATALRLHPGDNVVVAAARIHAGSRGGQGMRRRSSRSRSATSGHPLRSPPASRC